MTDSRQAVIYRMVLPHHTCPYGVRAKQMLEEAGYDVTDRILRSREEVGAFLDVEGVDTTPQVFIGEERVGGSDEVEAYLIKEQSAVP
jgi:glutaredoxin 3